MDYVSLLPLCQLPTNVPANLSNDCKRMLQNQFSYNGCLNYARSRAGFDLDTWRVYLNSSIELWGNSHDVIRLLDSEGRTVDALSY